MPDPVVIVPPGVFVNVQVPEAGRSVNITLPVDVKHVGCVIELIIGTPGVGGCVLITILADDAEVHPDEFVTEYEYVPAERPDTVELTPVPTDVMPPGDFVNVQEPVAGNPLKITLPSAIVHVGCVMVPTDGIAGVAGWELITTLEEDADIHPAELETV
jgi:hypothetical protein